MTPGSPGTSPEASRDPDQIPDRPDRLAHPDQASVPRDPAGSASVAAPDLATQIRRAFAVAAGALSHWVRGCARTGRGRVVLAAAAVLVLAVPSGVGFALASTLGGGGGGAAGTGVATIGVLAPTSGGSSDAGVSVRNAVTLAVEEANEQGAVPGWRFEVAAHDDLSRPDGGAAGADLFADDSRMIGVVGPVSSSVAMVSLGELSAAGLAVISPSNAEPTLTVPESTPNTRPYPTYFRLSGTDDLLAQVAADYAVQTLGRVRISVIDGGPDYGTITLAERFARYARDNGAVVPTVHRVGGASADERELTETAKAVRDEAPDLVYLATGPAFAGELRSTLLDEGIAVQVLGADGLLDPDYLERTDSAADGDVITDLSVPLSRLPAAGAFVTAYSERFGGPTVGADGLLRGNPPSTPPSTRPPAPTSPAPTSSTTPTSSSTAVPAPTASSAASSSASSAVQREQAAALAALRADAIPPVAAYAYDAARALIRAAATVLPGRTQVDAAARAAVVRAVGRGDFAGITGRIAFDEKGDARHPAVVLYSVLGGRFVPLQVDPR